MIRRPSVALRALLGVATACALAAAAAGPLTSAGAAPALPGIGGGGAPTVLTGTVSRVLGSLPRIGLTDPLRRIHLDAELALPDRAGLDAFVTSVSQPGSASFHQFVDPAAFGHRFGASQAAVDRVTEALTSLGFSVSPVSANHLMVGFDGSVGLAERVFAVQLADVRLPDGSTAFANLDNIRLPASLSGLVTGIVGLDSLAKPRAQLATATPHGATLPATTPAAVGGGASPCVAATAGGGYTAPDLATAYNFNGLYSAGYHGEGMTIALVEFDDFHDSNVASVLSCYGLTTPVTRRLVDGGVGGPPAAGETEDMADISVLLEMLPNLAHLVVYVAPITGTGEIDLFNAFATDHKATVLSSSWGNCELLNSAADNRLFATISEEAAAQGQQMLTASGDSGAVDCRGFPPPTGGSISVEQEAGVPWVTGVGGTALGQESVTGAVHDEVVWNDAGASGGGVSTYWQMPAWQAALPSAVSAPGATGAACGAAAGKLCREVPDISATADCCAGMQGNGQQKGVVIPSLGYSIFCATTNCALAAALGLPIGPLPLPGAGTVLGWEPIGGTSLSTPLTAAAFLLWDQEAKARGIGAMGLLNPSLYRVGADPAKYAADFHDIIAAGNGTGDSNDAEFDSGDCGTGCNPSHLYAVQPGYDMATGLGSYDATALGADIVADAGHLDLSPDATTVYGYVGGVPTTAPVVVSSGLTGATYTAQSDAAWLHVAGGTVPGALAWSADPAGLGAGSQAGHITINAGGHSATLTVTYTVTPRAHLSVSPSALAFSESAVGAAGCGTTLWNDELGPKVDSTDTTPVDPNSKRTLTIGNDGPAGSALHWSAFFYSQTSFWLSAELESGTTQTTASSSLIPTEGTLASGASTPLKLISLGNGNAWGGYPRMNTGTYHGIVYLYDLADPGFVATVPATLVLGDGSHTPGISPAPRVVALTLQPGAKQTVNVALSDSSNACGYVYTAQGDAPWISLGADTYGGTVAPTGTTPSTATPSDTGQGTGTMPVTIDTTGMAPGTYSSDIRIQSENAEVNPTSIPVVLVVAGAVTLPPTTVTPPLPTPNTAAGTSPGAAAAIAGLLVTCVGLAARRRGRLGRD